MLSPLDESELAAAWRRAAGPDGKVPVNIFWIFFVNIFLWVAEIGKKIVTEVVGAAIIESPVYHLTKNLFIIIIPGKKITKIFS